MHEAIDPGSERDSFFINLESEFLRENTNFSDKVMYGSDWHMANLIGKTDKFMDVFDTFFLVHSQCSVFKSNFFFNNAIQFLGLKDYLKKQSTIDFFGDKSPAIEHLKSLV